jgi:hypothetical protein
LSELRVLICGGLLHLRSTFCDASGSSAWCREANIAKLPTDVIKAGRLHPQKEDNQPDEPPTEQQYQAGYRPPPCELGA